MNKAICLALLAAALSACGGGSTSSNTKSEGAPDTQPPITTTPTDPKPTDPPEVQPPVAATTVTRTSAESGCQVTQLISPKAASSNLTISRLNWVQVVQQDMVDEATLIAGQKALMARVDVTASQSEPLPAKAQLILGSADGLCKTYELTALTRQAPQVVDPYTLNASYTVTIPAKDVTEDLAGYQVVINPLAAYQDTASERLYASGPLHVQAPITERIIIRPMSFRGVAAVYPSKEEIATFFKRTLPHADFTISIGKVFTPTAVTPNRAVSTEGFFLNPSAYVFDFNTMVEAINQLDTECFSDDSSAEPNNTKCMVFFPPNISFLDASKTGNIAGLGSPQSVFMYSVPRIDFPRTDPYEGGWLDGPGLVLVHEFMHVMRVFHTNGCNADGIDPRLYPDGTIGSHGAGYDSGRNFYFANRSDSVLYDFMSYCDSHRWTSDVAYRGIMDYKAGLATPPAIFKAKAPAFRASYASDVAAKPVIRLAYFDGKWHAALTQGSHSMQQIFSMQGSAISPLLAGLPVYGVPMHDGLRSNGVLYVPVTDSIASLLKTKTLAAILGF